MLTLATQLEKSSLGSYALLYPGIMKLFLLAALLFISASSFAQVVAVPAYEFLTLEEVEAGTSKLSFISFSPSFQGKAKIPLEELPTSFEKALLAHQHNLLIINQQLEALTVAGWELVQVYTAPIVTSNGHDYLFRRRKP